MIAAEVTSTALVESCCGGRIFASPASKCLDGKSSEVWVCFGAPFRNEVKSVPYHEVFSPVCNSFQYGHLVQSVLKIMQDKAPDFDRAALKQFWNLTCICCPCCCVLLVACCPCCPCVSCAWAQYHNNKVAEIANQIQPVIQQVAEEVASITSSWPTKVEVKWVTKGSDALPHLETTRSCRLKGEQAFDQSNVGILVWGPPGLNLVFRMPDSVDLTYKWPPVPGQALMLGCTLRSTAWEETPATKQRYDEELRESLSCVVSLFSEKAAWDLEEVESRISKVCQDLSVANGQAIALHPQVETSISILKLLGLTADTLQEHDNDLQTDAGFRAISNLSQILNVVCTIWTHPLPRVGRVVGGVEEALRGFAIEKNDGTRSGHFLELGADGSKYNFLGDAAIAQRHGRWEKLQDGEYIVEVHGHDLNHRHKRGSLSLAWSIDLVLNTGRVIQYSGSDEEKKGSSFSFKADLGYEIDEVKFSEGCCSGISSAPRSCSGSMDFDVKKAFEENGAKVMKALAYSSSWKGSVASKYAYFQAEALGFAELFARERVLKKNEIPVPDYWTVHAMQNIDVAAGLQTGDSERRNWFALIQLEDQDIRVFQNLFDATFRRKYTRDRKGAKVPDHLRIQKGFRIQNLLNWEEYRTKQEKVRSEMMSLKDSGQSVLDTVANLKTSDILPKQHEFMLDAVTNEAWLFHGTTLQAANAIAMGSFLISKAGSHAGTLFGKGVYLAESCCKADEYSDENEEGLRCMLVCRTTLGNINYCDAVNPDVSALVESCVNGPFHSVVGDREKVHHTFREFIVYDDDQVNPAYLLWYTRVYDS